MLIKFLSKKAYPLNRKIKSPLELQLYEDVLVVVHIHCHLFAIKQVLCSGRSRPRGNQTGQEASLHSFPARNTYTKTIDGISILVGCFVSTSTWTEFHLHHILKNTKIYQDTTPTQKQKVFIPFHLLIFKVYSIKNYCKSFL